MRVTTVEQVVYTIELTQEEAGKLERLCAFASGADPLFDKLYDQLPMGGVNFTYDADDQSVVTGETV